MEVATQQDDLVQQLAGLSPRIQNLREVKLQRQALEIDIQAASQRVAEAQANLERLGWAESAKKETETHRLSPAANYVNLRRTYEAQLAQAKEREQAAQTALQELDARPDMALLRFVQALKQALGDL